MALLSNTGRTGWAGPTWRIYAASKGLEKLLDDGKPCGFLLESEGTSFYLRPTTTNGLPSVFQPMGLMTPQEGDTSVNLEVRLTPFSGDALPERTGTAVRAYWDFHEAFTRLPGLTSLHKLVGRAMYDGEEHTVSLYQLNNVLSDPDKTLLVIQFKTLDSIASPDGWAIGHN